MKKLATLFAIILSIFTAETTAALHDYHSTNASSGNHHYTVAGTQETRSQCSTVAVKVGVWAGANVVSLGLIGGGIALCHTPAAPLGIIFLVVGGLFQISQWGVLGLFSCR